MFLGTIFISYLKCFKYFTAENLILDKIKNIFREKIHCKNEVFSNVFHENRYLFFLNILSYFFLLKF